jgi:hypothetical protein
MARKTTARARDEMQRLSKTFWRRHQAQTGKAKSTDAKRRSAHEVLVEIGRMRGNNPELSDAAAARRYVRKHHPRLTSEASLNRRIAAVIRQLTRARKADPSNWDAEHDKPLFINEKRRKKL